MRLVPVTDGVTNFVVLSLEKNKTSLKRLRPSNYAGTLCEETFTSPDFYS
jgi:hypothetical protein